MPTPHTCWLCTTPPAMLARQLLQTLCQCGYELQFHCYGPPHAMPVVGCKGFEVSTPAPAPEPDAQPTLF